MSQDSIGQLVMMVVHVVAQVVAKCLYDDTDDFTDELYRCLAVLNDELFFACNDSNKGGEETKQSLFSLLEFLKITVLLFRASLFLIMLKL